MNKIIDIDKSIMIFLNKDISNPVYDLIMPIITSNDFLTVIGVILIFYLLFSNIPSTLPAQFITIFFLEFITRLIIFIPTNINVFKYGFKKTVSLDVVDLSKLEISIYDFDKKKIKIDKKNSNLIGEDNLIPINQNIKILNMYSIRFHLYPGINAVQTMGKNSILIQVEKNKSLIFTSNGDDLVLEKSIFLCRNQIINNFCITVSGTLNNCENKNILSKDIGPGNCLIDNWIRTNSNKKFDQDGDLASSGTKNEIIFVFCSKYLCF